MKRRIGKIIVSDQLTHEEKQALFDWLRLVPYRVEHLLYSRSLECIGTSPHFEEMEEGMVCPEYHVAFTKTEEGFTGFDCLRLHEKPPLETKK